MLKAAAEVSLKKINTEISLLNPSALLQFFEIDLSDLVFNKGLVGISDAQKTFRFHNNIKLINTDIIWQGKRYIAAPIAAEGFEINSRGTLPQPKLNLTTSDAGISALTSFKQMIRNLGDIIGAKVTRKRTFAKYIDAINFYAIDFNGNAILNQPIDKDLIPNGFEPDANTQFPHDIYYVDRKSAENKTTFEFELASILDIEGIKIPGRLVLANRCVLTYRGCGCWYEYNNNRTSIHEDGELPDSAPPIATEKGERIPTLIGRNIVVRGQWDARKNYNIGDAVWIEKRWN